MLKLTMAMTPLMIPMQSGTRLFNNVNGRTGTRAKHSSTKMKTAKKPAEARAKGTAEFPDPRLRRRHPIESNSVNDPPKSMLPQRVCPLALPGTEYPTSTYSVSAIGI